MLGGVQRAPVNKQRATAAKAAPPRPAASRSKKRYTRNMNEKDLKCLCRWQEVPIGSKLFINSTVPLNL